MPLDTAYEKVETYFNKSDLVLQETFDHFGGWVVFNLVSFLENLWNTIKIAVIRSACWEGKGEEKIKEMNNDQFH